MTRIVERFIFQNVHTIITKKLVSNFHAQRQALIERDDILFGEHTATDFPRPYSYNGLKL